MLDLSKLPPRAASALMAAYRQADANGAVLPAHVGAALAGGGTIEFPLAGLVPSDDDVQDYPYVWSGRPPLADMDYRGECSPIKNQRHAGACTAFHATGHAERYAKLAGRLPPGGYAERANYNMARALLGFTGDSGATLRGAIHAGYKYGFPLESTFPYTDDPAAINDLTVPPEVMAEAAGNRLDAYYRIEPSLHDEFALRKRIDCALADGYTVGVGTFVFRWFMHMVGPLATHAAVRSSPETVLPAGQHWWDVMGGHALVIVGRSEALGGYIYRNSWDTVWGEAGYGLLLYSDLQVAFEFWAVAGFDGSDVGGAYDIECAEAKAARLYRAALGRYPEAAGLAYQTAALTTYGHLQVARNFMASPEFQRRYGPGLDDGGFVTALYANVLGRSPEPAGLAYHMQALAAGMERAQLLINFAESPENRAAP